MITEFPLFRQPANAKISVWRYMNVEKLLWMIEHEALYFCRLDVLEDKYEGHYTKASVTEGDSFLNAVIPIGEISKYPIGRNVIIPTAREAILRTGSFVKKDAFVNCWHMNESESPAMWKLHDVCIRSNYEILAYVLPSLCYLGCIEYIDYERDKIDSKNPLNRIMRKRRQFDFEMELRAVACAHRGIKLPCRFIGDKGVMVPVDLTKLVQEILVDPDVEPALRGRVEECAGTHGIKAQVRLSTLNDAPRY